MRSTNFPNGYMRITWGIRQDPPKALAQPGQGLSWRQWRSRGAGPYSHHTPCARVRRCIRRTFGERPLVPCHGRVWRLYVAIFDSISIGAHQVAAQCYVCQRRASRKYTAEIRGYYAPYSDESAIAHSPYRSPAIYSAHQLRYPTSKYVTILAPSGLSRLPLSTWRSTSVPAATR